MMFKKMMYLVLIIALGLVSGAKGDVIDSFENGPGAWEIMNPPETLAQSTEGVTDGSYSLERNFTAGFHYIDLPASNFIEALNTNDILEIDVTTSLTTAEVDGYLQLRIILQGGNETGNYYIEGPLFNIASPDGTPTTTIVSFEYKPELTDGPLINWAKLRIVNNSGGEGVVYYDNFRIVSPPPPPSAIMIGDFEDGSLDNWAAAGDGTAILSNSTTGVTSGSGSLSVKTTGGYWAIQWNAPTIPESLAETKLSFDLTMIASEWPVSNWTKVAEKIALNSDNPDGWKEFTEATAINKLTGESVGLDWGRWSETTPDIIKTYTVDISDYDLTDANWFQIQITLQGGDGQAHFYIDNVRLLTEVEAPTDETPKSTDIIIGNWEQDLDGWVVGGGGDAIFNDHNGVTLDNYSLDIYLPNGDWNQDILTLSILDNELLDAFKVNRKISVDVTRLVADWPADDIPPWNNIRIILDAGGANWNIWQDLGELLNWRQTDGDQTKTATWDYGQYFAEIDFEDLTWLTLRFVSNANSEDYSGWVWFYLDNMIMFGGGSSLEPQPADGTKDVPVDSTLSWIAGPFAATHHVYLGTNAVKVNYAEIGTYQDVEFAEVDEASFDPNELELDTQYFWRVDEVNEANPDSPWKGLVWSFTTANYKIVDDFEDYDSGENRIWYAWHDGLGYGTQDSGPYFAGNGTGSAVGDDTTASFCEETIVHGGGKSIPIYFDNTGAAVISEADRVWDEPQDWTWNIIGLNVMKLYIHGAAQNTPGELYLVIEDSEGVSGKATYADSAIFTTEEWTEWEISLNNVAAGGLNLAAVKKLVIGVSNLAGQAKASGTLYIDDIQRHPPVVVSLESDHLVVPKTSAAPVIDGQWDAVWNDVNETQCLITEMANTDNATPEDSNDLSAVFKAFYDETNFYIFVEINDSVIDYEFSDYQGDGIEIYFDGDYSHTDSYDGVNDNQIRITVDDVAIEDTDSSLAIDGMVFKVLLTATGYNIEASFPLEALQIYPSEDRAPLLDSEGVEIPNSGIAPNNVIGFEVQINDNDSGGVRETLLRWHSDDNNSYQDPSLFGQARLVSETVGN